MSETQSPGKIVEKGSVGERGNTATVEHKLKTKIAKFIIVRNVETSLCGNTGAFAFLFKNGQEVSNGSITELGSTMLLEAAPEDQVAVFVTLYPLFNDIQCIRLGDLNFNVIEMDILP